MSESRFLEISRWLRLVLPQHQQIKLISGDASFRRYFRVTQYNEGREERFILMDSPTKLIPLTPFLELTKSYQKLELNPPKVIAQNLEAGLLLLSDLGDILLLSRLTLQNVAQYYAKALTLLDKVVLVKSTATYQLPQYDSQFVLTELNIFRQWFLGTHLQLNLAQSEQQLLDDTFQFLSKQILSQPVAGMHRDFHSRNLMLTEADNGDEILHVIDYQDTVVGPITYDAVSLLRDCYARWPEPIIEPLMLQHYQQMRAAKVLDSSVDFNQYKIWFDLTGLQRHIKAVGIFARLNYRDNKPAYMDDIPLTLGYIEDISACYPQLTDFSQWITRSIKPAFKARVSGKKE